MSTSKDQEYQRDTLKLAPYTAAKLEHSTRHSDQPTTHALGALESHTEHFEPSSDAGTMNGSTPKPISRREMFTWISGLAAGAGTLSLLGCSAQGDEETPEELASTAEALGDDKGTISELRAVAAPTSGNPSYLVLGNSSPGDGLGGVYVWKVFSQNAPTDDGLTVIRPNNHTGNGRWLRVAENVEAVTVANIEGLKALQVPSSGAPTRTVAGYSARGDGGGGDFVWDPTRTDPEVRGVVVVPNNYTGAGRWCRIFSDRLNVSWFGAKGDGATNPQADDTDALQTAINYAASSGKLLFFPPGNYAIKQPLQIGEYARLQGSGRATTIQSHADFVGTELFQLYGTLIEGYRWVRGVDIQSFGFSSRNTAVAAIRQAAELIANGRIEDIFLDLSFGIILDSYTQGCQINRVFSLGALD